MPRLTLKFKDNTLGTYTPKEDKPITIGRRKGNHIVIDNLAVSGKHARIGFNADGWILQDRDSKNGTFVNGKHVKNHILKDGDIITIGKHTIVFEENPSNKPEEIDPENGTDASSGSSMEPGEIAMLTFLSGGTGSIRLGNTPTTIGKQENADIVVKGFSAFLAGDTAATISLSNKQYFISKVSGIMGIKVNDQPVRSTTVLSNMDIIKIGPVVLKFTTQ